MDDNQAKEPEPVAAPEQSSGEAEEVRHADVQYEAKDINFGCLLTVMFAAILVVATVTSAMWGLYWWQAKRAETTREWVNSLETPLSRKLPPEPRLEQLNTMAGVKSSNVFERLSAQEKVLNSSGPSDEKGFVHIQIQQAIKQTAGKLPAREGPPPGPTGKDRGLVDSGESNSGRMLRGGQQ